jgi:hypothetical protein
MNLNSRLFDRIRTKPLAEEVVAPEAPRCNHPGCALAGEHRAPMGRDREGQYFSFCIDHVREYNARYNYFAGMSDDAVAQYQKEAVVGHRPTWSMGTHTSTKRTREGDPENGDFSDTLGLFRNRTQAGKPEAPRPPRYAQTTIRALAVLDLDDGADAPAIKTRYKELVKRLHPDANGGDRSCEGKLREIIQAYKHLKATKLV